LSSRRFPQSIIELFTVFLPRPSLFITELGKKYWKSQYGIQT